MYLSMRWLRVQPIMDLPTTNSHIDASFIMAHKTKNTPANNNSEEFSNGLAYAIFYAGGIVLSLSTVTFAIPSTILTICSNNNLNEVVENYNPKTSSDITLNFGATENGIGLMVKF